MDGDDNDDDDDDDEKEKSIPRLQLSLKILKPFVNLPGFNASFAEKLTPLFRLANFSLEDPRLVKMLMDPEIDMRLKELATPESQRQFRGKFRQHESKSAYFS